MRFDAPPPGEELKPGAVTEPRQAASLILLRDSREGPEVLLVKRNPEQRFMGGAWVFPGGAQRDRVDCGAGTGDSADADQFDILVGCESVVGRTRRRP